jgi:serine protease Do
MPKITYLEEETVPHRFSGRKKPTSFVAILIIVGFVTGLIGGTASLIVLSNSKYLKDKLGINLQNLNISQTTTQHLVLEESSKVIDAAKTVTPAVVSITTSQNVQDFFGQVSQQQGGGTGIIITNDGLIVTNKHVAQAGDSLKVLTADGKTYDAQVVALDPTNDLAILKINATGLPVVQLGDSSSLQVGQWVIAVGNALGNLQNTVTVGVISARERQLTAGDGTQSEQLSNLLQTDAAINPGNSGGPLVNLAGQVIGIDTAVAGGAQGIGFAIPINEVQQAINSYQKTGKIVKPLLGVRYVSITPQVVSQLNLTVNNGALIMAPQGTDAVQAGSPADAAGLKANDIILQINGEAVDVNHSLASRIGEYQPGDEVTVTYSRNKAQQTVKLKLGSIGS